MDNSIHFDKEKPLTKNQSHSIVALRPSHGFIGLKNQGATDYLNCVIHVFYMSPEFRQMIFRCEKPWDQLLVLKDTKSILGESNPSSKDVIFQMQLLFARMQLSPVDAVSTSGLINSFGWDS